MAHYRRTCLKKESLHSIFDAHCADRRYVKTMALVYKGVPLAFCSYNRVNECNQDFSPIEFCALLLPSTRSSQPIETVCTVVITWQAWTWSELEASARQSSAH